MPAVDSTTVYNQPTAGADTSAVAVSDTAATAKVIVNALEQRTCHEVDAPYVLHLRNATLGRVDYVEGLQPEPRPLLPGYDSGVMCMLIVIFLVLTANFRHYSTFIKTFAQDLFSVRRRSNAFDDPHTVSETRVLLSLVSLVCLCEGVLLFSAITFHTGSYGIPAFAAVGLLTLLAALYYLWQLIAYQTVGFMFSSSEATRQWVKGFNASQSLLGLVLLLPALLALFNPGMTPLLTALSVGLYGVARIIFISKGFRIFYDNYLSLVYFILYLCTLEIIPPVLLYRFASYITLSI